jgi:hypothetical protein
MESSSKGNPRRTLEAIGPPQGRRLTLDDALHVADQMLDVIAAAGGARARLSGKRLRDQGAKTRRTRPRVDGPNAGRDKSRWEPFRTPPRNAFGAARRKRPERAGTEPGASRTDAARKPA